jgi:hypothetical protein
LLLASVDKLVLGIENIVQRLRNSTYNPSRGGGVIGATPLDLTLSSSPPAPPAAFLPLAGVARPQLNNPIYLLFYPLQSLTSNYLHFTFALNCKAQGPRTKAEGISPPILVAHPFPNILSTVIILALFILLPNPVFLSLILITNPALCGKTWTWFNPHTVISWIFTYAGKGNKNLNLNLNIVTYDVYWLEMFYV